MRPMAIVMSLADRPYYAEQALDALARCHGIGHHVLLPHCEPWNERLWEIVNAFDACPCYPTWNKDRLGPTANIREAWRDGFTLSDYVLLVEEDVVLAPDALEYHAWARDEFRGDRSTFSATAYNRRDGPCPPHLHHAARTRVWFHPWGTGTWKDRWDLVDGLPEDPGATWDHAILREVSRLGMREVYPELSRCQNIGRITTVHDPAVYTPEWYDEHHRLKHWSGNAGRIHPGPWTRD